MHNPLSANPTEWPNTLKQFVGKLPTNCLSVFGLFINLALQGIIIIVLTKILLINFTWAFHVSFWSFLFYNSYMPVG